MSVIRRRFERVRIYVSEPENYHGEMDLGRVNVNATCDELFGPLFQGYNYVCLVAIFHPSCRFRPCDMLL